VEKIRLIHKSGGVYYHYQFKYLYKLTNTRKRLRVEKTRLDAWNGQAKGSVNTARAFFCLQEESGKAGTSARADDKSCRQRMLTSEH
jgi:hypothetical protein